VLRQNKFGNLGSIYCTVQFVECGGSTVQCGSRSTAYAYPNRNLRSTVNVIWQNIWCMMSSATFRYFIQIQHQHSGFALMWYSVILCDMWHRCRSELVLCCTVTWHWAGTLLYCDMWHWAGTMSYCDMWHWAGTLLYCVAL